MLNRDVNRDGQEAVKPLDPWKFGAPGRDPVEIGRRGGQKSGLSRRLRSQRVLEERIAATRNGAAIFGLYRTQLERDRALERERIRLDRVVNALMDESDREREEIARLRGRRLEILERIGGLERREQELRARLESAEGLAQLLAEVPEDRLTAALVALGHEIHDEEAPSAVDVAAYLLVPEGAMADSGEPGLEASEATPGATTRPRSMRLLVTTRCPGVSRFTILHPSMLVGGRCSGRSTRSRASGSAPACTRRVTPSSSVRSVRVKSSAGGRGSCPGERGFRSGRPGRSGVRVPAGVVADMWTMGSTETPRASCRSITQDS